MWPVTKQKACTGSNCHPVTSPEPQAGRKREAESRSCAEEEGLAAVCMLGNDMGKHLERRLRQCISFSIVAKSPE